MTAFTDRLRVAEEIIDGLVRDGLDLPAHIEDQFVAASRDMGARVRRLAGREGVVDPINGAELWPLATMQPGRRRGAYLLATLMACRFCPHLVSPRPAHVFMELRRAVYDDCARAILAAVGSPARLGQLRDGGDELIAVPVDRCDICEEPAPSNLFYPVSMFAGPQSYAGNACRDCYAVVTEGESTPVPKVGRNEPCPCGSGRKWKHCHERQNP